MKIKSFFLLATFAWSQDEVGRCTARTLAFGVVRSPTKLASNVNEYSEGREDDSPASESRSLPTPSGSSLDTRRSVLSKTAAAMLVGSSGGLSFPGPGLAAVGTLPEFADTNAVLQGITVNVADKGQQDLMIKFLENGFLFKVLRSKVSGSVTDTWLGFGPEQLSIPADFELPVSSFSRYGGHASVRVRYDAKSEKPLYTTGDPPGDNVAFLQIGVPTYRISQMVKNGGNIIDAFGYVNVISPAGLPIRGIVGISPDPIMFIALNCQDLKASRAFYEQLGFAEQEYPYSRPSKGMGQFEPPQPPNSVYLAPSPNCMGVLLLQNKDKKKVKPNPVLQSLNIVYAPSAGADTTDIGSEIRVVDPVGVPVSFVPVDAFEIEESISSAGLNELQNQ